MKEATMPVTRIVLGMPLKDAKVALNAIEASRFTGHYTLYVLSALDGGHLMYKGFPGEFVYEKRATCA